LTVTFHRVFGKVRLALHLVIELNLHFARLLTYLLNKQVHFPVDEQLSFKNYQARDLSFAIIFDQRHLLRYLKKKTMLLKYDKYRQLKAKTLFHSKSELTLTLSPPRVPVRWAISVSGPR
jgi:hypothetical protein